MRICGHAIYTLPALELLMLTAQIDDTRPAAQRTQPQAFVPDPDGPQLVMAKAHYDGLSNTVQAWKRENKIGRFDPTAPARMAAAREAQERAIKERGIEVGKRC